MADAIPPAQVQVVALKSLKKDVELSLQNQLSKSGGVQRASIVDVKKWLDAALKSPDDEPIALASRGQRPSPSLNGAQVKNFLETFNTKLDARVAELQKDPSAASKTLAQWTTAAIVEASVNRATLVVKGGESAPVSREELEDWLRATEQPVEASPKKQ